MAYGEAVLNKIPSSQQSTKIRSDLLPDDRPARANHCEKPDKELKKTVGIASHAPSSSRPKRVLERKLKPTSSENPCNGKRTYSETQSLNSRDTESKQKEVVIPVRITVKHSSGMTVVLKGSVKSTDNRKSLSPKDLQTLGQIANSRAIQLLGKRVLQEANLITEDLQPITKRSRIETPNKRERPTKQETNHSRGNSQRILIEPQWKELSTIDNDLYLDSQMQWGSEVSAMAVSSTQECARAVS